MPHPRDTFAANAAGYAAARPTYPAALFTWLVSQCRPRMTAWDCGTGNGQAAVALAPHFHRVQATDLKREQIEHAHPVGNVTYGVCPAEATPFPARTFDLVVVAQALHWFVFAKFWPEVDRVARDGAVFGAWGYDWFRSSPEIDGRLVEPLKRLIHPFWAPEIRILWGGYRQEDIRMPFARLEVPEFSIEVHWTLRELVAYVTTWSAFQRSQEDAPARGAIDDLLWRTRDMVPANERIRITMPLKLVAGRIRGT